MELGMIGLGRMGTSMVRRLLRAGHRCVVYGVQPDAVQTLAKEGAVGTPGRETMSGTTEHGDLHCRPARAGHFVKMVHNGIEYGAADLADFNGWLLDSGEGRWTTMARIDESAPAPVISAALYDRFSSRCEADFAHKVLSAMRHGFGGHMEKAASTTGGAQ